MFAMSVCAVLLTAASIIRMFVSLPPPPPLSLSVSFGRSVDLQLVPVVVGVARPLPLLHLQVSARLANRDLPSVALLPRLKEALVSCDDNPHPAFVLA